MVTQLKSYSQNILPWNMRTSLPVSTMPPHFRQPDRRKIHQRVVQAVAQFTAEEWLGLLVTMRDAVQSVWQASG